MLLNFLITFLLMLISGSIFVLGFYTITRGKKVLLPNGKTEIEKEIFGDWQLYFEDIKGYKKIYYEGKLLEYKLKLLEQSNPNWIGIFTPEKREKKSLIPTRTLQEWEIRDIEWHLNSNALYNGDALFLYDEFPVYRFPEWLRKITNCPICLASVSGTFFYWTLLYIFPAIIPNHPNNPTLCKLIFWIIYCISLSFVNKVVKQNLDKERK